MESLITASLLGSIITIIIKSVIDLCSERTKYKRELRKLIFERKTDAVEKAMSWYQEAIDAYSMMQMAFNEIVNGSTQFALSKLSTAC